jgi:Gluconate 2-dehydrogenase subunit 3
MDRRELLQRVSLLLGGTILGANAFLTGCRSASDEDGGGSVDVNFTEADIAYLDEVAETIIPTTSTPGAKAAKVGAFMAVMVKDCYTERDQQIFHKGMDKLNDASKKKFDKTFMNATPEQRHELLTGIDKEVKEETEKQKRDREVNIQKEQEETDEQKQNPTTESEKTRQEKRQEKPKEDPPRHYFRMMKELTLLGYFTSEIGQKQALRYEPVPGRYEGCVDYKKGDKAWA